ELPKDVPIIEPDLVFLVATHATRGSDLRIEAGGRAPTEGQLLGLTVLGFAGYFIELAACSDVEFIDAAEVLAALLSALPRHSCRIDVGVRTNSVRNFKRLSVSCDGRPLDADIGRRNLDSRRARPVNASINRRVTIAPAGHYRTPAGRSMLPRHSCTPPRVLHET